MIDLPIIFVGVFISALMVVAWYGMGLNKKDEK
jgi:hypothetical protein